MGRISSTIRITIGLVSLAVTLLLCAYSIGLVPDREATVTAGRQDLCEALAIQCSALASEHNTRLITTVLEATCQRNRDMLFAGVYRRDGTLLTADGDDAACPHKNTTCDTTECRMTVPILDGNQTWGSLEIVFRPLVGSGLTGLLQRDIVQLTLAIAGASLVSYFVYLRRLLQDQATLVALAERLKLTAHKNGVSSIADVAEEFERAARENGEEMQLAELANDLLDLCRATQKAYLGDPILGAVPMMSTVGSP